MKISLNVREVAALHLRDPPMSLAGQILRSVAGYDMAPMCASCVGIVPDC